MHAEVTACIALSFRERERENRMATQVEWRTADRLARLVTFMETLHADGYGYLPPPFAMPVAALQSPGSTLPERWDIADDWLNDVAYTNVPVESLFNTDAHPLIRPFKQRVAEWRRHEGI